MALYRRILWPNESNNTAVECLYGECPYDCSVGGLPCSPPVPPPLTPIRIARKNQHLPTLIIIIASIIATCFLLLTYYAILRYRSSRRRRRLNTPAPPQATDDGDDLHEDLIEEEAHTHLHHVWYIRTVGLDEATIDAIAACMYKRGEGLIEGTECSVCLNDFRNGELVRLLPKCSHAFHIPCIDTWLKSHVNCPLCRAPVVASPPITASSDGRSSQHSSSSSSSAAATFPVGVISTTLPSPAVSSRPSESNPLAYEDGTEDCPAWVSEVGIIVDLAGCSFSSEVSGFGVPNNLGNCGGHQLEDHVAVDVPEISDGLQPVQRSVSMDSSALGGLLLRVVSEGSSDDGRKKPSLGEYLATKNRGQQDNNSKEASLQSTPLEMERSLSSSGGKFFLSRFSGRVRNAILPL